MDVRDGPTPSAGSGQSWPTFLSCVALFLSVQRLYGADSQGTCEMAFEIWVALIICVLSFPLTIEAFLLSGAHDGRQKPKEKERRVPYAMAPFPTHRAKSWA